MSGKYFPIKTKTACQLKWAWSTLYLNNGETKSCHRTGQSELTPENFLNFHNTLDTRRGEVLPNTLLADYIAENPVNVSSIEFFKDQMRIIV